MEDVTAVQLIVCILSAYSTRRVNNLKLGVDVHLDMIKSRVARMNAVLHNLLKSTLRKRLHVLYDSIYWNMLRKP